MDTEKQRQRRRDDSWLTESRDARSEQLLMMPTESLLTNGEWLPGELLSGSECRAPGWFLDMNIRLVLWYMYMYVYVRGKEGEWEESQVDFTKRTLCSEFQNFCY